MRRKAFRVVLHEYDLEHVTTTMPDMLTLFPGAVQVQDVHPLRFGFIRRKIRWQRRPNFPLENPLLFYRRHRISCEQRAAMAAAEAD